MSRLYQFLIAAHALAAVLGLGLITAIAIASAAARRSRPSADSASSWLPPLLRYSALALAAMLVTGVCLDIAASGAWSRTWWFRGSVLLLIATGALHRRTRVIVRNRGSDGRITEAALLRVSRMALGMCGLVAVITVLMEVKPF